MKAHVRVDGGLLEEIEVEPDRVEPWPLAVLFNLYHVLWLRVACLLLDAGNHVYFTS